MPSGEVLVWGADGARGATLTRWTTRDGALIGLKTLPKAQLHVQRNELAHASGPCMARPFLRRPYEPEQVAAYLRRVRAAAATAAFRLKLMERMILPRWRARRSSAHTAG